MRSKSGAGAAARSVYAEYYVKGSHRARHLPRLERPWRPRVIAWAGPTAFSRNRFYEMDQWYKARIDRPEIVPHLHTVDPDKYLHSLEERLSAEQIQPERIDIGYKERSSKIESEELPRSDLERLSRTMQLKVNMKQLDHFSLEIFHHFRIFDDLFNSPVFFHIVQKMDISYDDYGVYHGNVLHAVDTMKQPNVTIESVGNGYSTLLVLNIDGNPYESSKQLCHWFLANIEDGSKDISSSGEQIIPYLQALPFKGTGFHRLVFILFHHEQRIDFSAYKLESNELNARSFNMQHFYKTNETLLTPSSVAFSQIVWDISVNKTLHTLGMKAPLYEYEYRPALKMPQKEFPVKPQPFDLYLDQFRDPIEVEAELLKKRLHMSRIDERPKQPKYPDMNYVENKKKLPAWQHARMISENSGQGKNYALWNNPID